MTPSLHLRVGLLWGLLFALSLLLGVVLWLGDHYGPSAQVKAAQADTATACTNLQQAHARLVSARDASDANLLNIVVDLTLREAPGIEGGIWEPARGFVAYAYPTHDGASRKVDVPEAEIPSILALVKRLTADTSSAQEVRRGQREAVALAACALPNGQVAWTLKRVAAAEVQVLQRFNALAAVALGAVVLAGAWVLIGLRRWSKRLDALARSLAERRDESAPLAATGERDLDRLVLALNASAADVTSLRADSQRLSGELVRADRLAALGRVAAGLAHEIRNPLGSMRLRAENALAVEGEAALERRSAALGSVLKTVARLEELVNSLLALTQPMRPQLAVTPLDAWLAEALAVRAEQAAQQGVALHGDAPAGLTAEIDAAALGRALDNLLLNALQHTPTGGRVDVQIERGTDTGIDTEAPRWRLRVQDDGPGIAAALRARLFEPFATGRAEGTGLGLAMAREIVAGHGGTLEAVPRPDGRSGACFVMELPWRAS